jgi:hypothetical protein
MSVWNSRFVKESYRGMFAFASNCNLSSSNATNTILVQSISTFSSGERQAPTTQHADRGHKSVEETDGAWSSPIELQEALTADPTYFHGRDGLATHWTPPSNVTSNNTAMVDIFKRMRKEKELQNLMAHKQ